MSKNKKQYTENGYNVTEVHMDEVGEEKTEFLKEVNGINNYLKTFVIPGTKRGFILSAIDIDKHQHVAALAGTNQALKAIIIELATDNETRGIFKEALTEVIMRDMMRGMSNRDEE